MTTSVTVRAPLRVLDAGGWTDTWFAGEGKVCHLAVDEGVEVTATHWEGDSSTSADTVELNLPAFGHRYVFGRHQPPGHHPLLEAALLRCSSDCALRVVVRSLAPAGSGLGTSGSAVVALIAALCALAGGELEPPTLARTAHEIETVDVGLESGVQDQIAAAYGGANLVVIDSYPAARVHSLGLETATWEALARRVITVYLGAPHRSSDLHEAVIEKLSASGAQAELEPLRVAAMDAADALVAGDIDAYGGAMVANTAAQAALHPALVSTSAREIFALAKGHSAVGWKVNGAGGDGGTVSIVGPSDPGSLVRDLQATAGLTVLPLMPARDGVRIVDHR